MDFPKSKELFSEAKRVIPGGVNSPVRAFGAVGMNPLFIQAGKGSRITDVDGNEYIDYVGSWGPLILGHAHPEVTKAVARALERGMTFGAPTELEVQMARIVASAIPSIEEVRMVSSGTEACMSALRLARGYTGRELIVKFEGGYHGHADSLLVKAGSGLATLGNPSSAGVTKGAAAETIVLPYNNLEAVERVFRDKGEQIAALIVEPVAANMGVILPRPDFLAGLRRITDDHGSILIFDEVITGFRVSYAAAQGFYNVNPDLTCLGKIIGGGLPVGAFGGRRDIMEKVAPVGAVYQAGTLSGNPIALTAGLTTIEILGHPGVYEELDKKGSRLADGLRQAVKDTGMAAQVTQVASLVGLFFTGREVYDYETASACDLNRYADFFAKMLEAGFYLAPSQFEAIFVSLAHTEEDIENTIVAARRVLAELQPN